MSLFLQFGKVLVALGYKHSFEEEAVNHIAFEAAKKDPENIAFINSVLTHYGIKTSLFLKECLLRSITINFHPDRFSANGKLIIENLIDSGVYEGQFRTGTSNGGLTAFPGGERFLWEQRLFAGIYPVNTQDRPKYGALNLLNYLDGASPRFGACYFVLKPSVISRCTFSYGDSSLAPVGLCTSEHFSGIAFNLLRDLIEKRRLLDWENCDPQRTIPLLMKTPPPSVRGNLDFYIETHIHGELSLQEDISTFFLDESYRDTDMERYARCLSQRYEIGIDWIPKREIRIDQIEDTFRGPHIPLLAEKVDSLLGGHRGVITPFLIGLASHSSTKNPSLWKDLGDPPQIFQSFKQLWHTTAYFGAEKPFWKYPNLLDTEKGNGSG